MEARHCYAQCMSSRFSYSYLSSFKCAEIITSASVMINAFSFFFFKLVCIEVDAHCTSLKFDCLESRTQTRPLLFLIKDGRLHVYLLIFSILDYIRTLFTYPRGFLKIASKMSSKQRSKNALDAI